ncbi:MAG: formimidoylglutamase [Bacteroidales bacterium]|nr:formimidoylglutamase [Bacteroidales bacterium]
MDLYEFLDPVSLDKPEEYLISSPNILGKNITTHTPDFKPADLAGYQVAFLGIPEDRNSYNRGTSLAPEKIRSQLYQLYKPSGSISIVDLGNVKQGNTFSDTYVALKEIMNHLLLNNLVVVLIGGSQELTIPVFQIFELHRQSINLTTIDRTIDIVKDNLRTSAESFLTELLFKKRTLFKYCNLGHQIHLTDAKNIDLIGKLYHDAIRLGELRSNMSMVEPIMRDSDIVSFDISAVRQSDSPGFFNPSPSGLYSEEACQLAKYAGLSDRVSTLGIFEVNPKHDILHQSSSLAAQIIWYFLDGFSCRNPEYPDSEDKNFKTFIVGQNDLDHEITFYKSLVSERWWMQIPNPKQGKPIVVACSYQDYKLASEQEVPDLWWKSFQKLS